MRWLHLVARVQRRKEAWKRSHLPSWHLSYHRDDSGNHLGPAHSRCGLYLRQPGAKPSSCQPGSLCGILGPRTGSALLAPAVLGGPGLPWGTALFQCPLFPLMNQDNFMNPGAFPFLNSGILAYIPVAVDLPGEGLKASTPEHPASIVLRIYIG